MHRAAADRQVLKTNSGLVGFNPLGATSSRAKAPWYPSTPQTPAASPPPLHAGSAAAQSHAPPRHTHASPPRRQLSASPQTAPPPPAQCPADRPRRTAETPARSPSPASKQSQASV